MMNDQHIKSGYLAQFNGPGIPFTLASFPVRDLQPGEILVRNSYTTICGSDLHTYCGLRNEPCPSVLGHEIAGRIEAIHPSHAGFDLRGKPLAPGDMVTWTVFSSNPQSPNSLRGIPQKGDNLYKYGHLKVEAPEVFHGGLAEYCILRANTGIIKLPESMPLPIAATLNCSISTVAGALRLAGDVKDKTVLITGMGLLGITCAAMCAEAGAEWIAAADIVDARLNDALGFGASEVFNLNGNNSALKQQLLEKTGGKGIDIVFDMSGSPDAMEFGMDVLGIGGTAIWVGAVFNTRPLQIDAERIIRNLVTIKGLHNYNFTDFTSAFDFMKRNWEKYPFTSVVEKEFTLQEVNEVFDYALAQKPLRVGVRL